VNPWDWDKFTWAWVFWLVWFFVWETWALVDRKAGGETFSEHVWALRNGGGSFAWFMVAAIAIWLAYHFIIEGWGR
jgi:hypothetical protein